MTPPRVAEGPEVTTLAVLWSAGLAVAALGTWILYDAGPGLNWGVMTLSLSLVFLGCAALSRGRVPLSPLTPIVLATALAAGTPLTVNAGTQLLIALVVCGLLAAASLLARDDHQSRLSVWTIATLPLQAGVHLAVECLRRLGEALLLCTSSRWRSLVRGVALALPTVGVLGLMLAGADPILTAGRDELVRLLTSLEIVPRAIFFGVLFVLASGTCGLAARGPAETPPYAGADRAGVGDTERGIVLGAVTLLFGGFLLLQLSYLFGNLPAAVGSGVTFAEYARRGFAELTIVTTLSVLLVMALDHGVARGLRGRRVRLVEALLLGELTLLLASAFRRLLLYEGAYGFTTARLYGQVYMIWLAAVLALLAIELAGRLDGHRLVRRSAAAAAVAFIGLVYWNHEAWIVRQNVARFAATRQLDAGYAVWSLSGNAVPALVASLDELPDQAAGPLRVELLKRCSGSRRADHPWYEWNLARSSAERAMKQVCDTGRGQKRDP
jgi:uncharacterized protein DUF4153